MISTAQQVSPIITVDPVWCNTCLISPHRSQAKSGPCFLTENRAETSVPVLFLREGKLDDPRCSYTMQNGVERWGKPGPKQRSFNRYSTNDGPTATIDMQLRGAPGWAGVVCFMAWPQEKERARPEAYWTPSVSPMASQDRPGRWLGDSCAAGGFGRQTNTRRQRRHDNDRGRAARWQMLPAGDSWQQNAKFSI